MRLAYWNATSMILASQSGLGAQELEGQDRFSASGPNSYPPGADAFFPDPVIDAERGATLY